MSVRSEEIPEHSLNEDSPPPIVHIYAREGKIWVGYSYPECARMVAAYEVRAAAAVSNEGDLIDPLRYVWGLSSPERNSQWACSTEISSSDIDVAYGQVRIRFEDGQWSTWSAVQAAQLGRPVLPSPPPIVEAFPKSSHVWVRYSYPSSPGIVGYSVRAGLELSAEGEIICPSSSSEWTLNGPPEINSSWSCATSIELTSIPQDAPVYVQARVKVAGGIWSAWSPSVASVLAQPMIPEGLSSPIPHLDIRPPPAPAQSLCRLMQPNGTWIEYIPDPKSVLIIAAGFNGNAARLQELGYHTTVLYDEHYDKYPDNWRMGHKDYLARPLRLDPAAPPHDHASFADDVILPMLYELVANGIGPAVVMAGSRGGQVTICRLWNMWHGPSIVLNGGCGIETAPPEGVPLGLLTQGRDFFPTKSLSYTQRLFSAWPGEVVVYHHDEDDHSVRTYNDAIELVLSIVQDIPLTRQEAHNRIRASLRGPALEGQVLLKQKGIGEGFDFLLK